MQNVEEVIIDYNMKVNWQCEFSDTVKLNQTEGFHFTDMFLVFNSSKIRVDQMQIYIMLASYAAH